MPRPLSPLPREGPATAGDGENGGAVPEASSRSPRVSPAPAFADVALLRAAGSEEPAVGSGAPPPLLGP